MNANGYRMSCQLHKVLLKNKWNKNSTWVNVAETIEQYPICYTRLSHTLTGPSNLIGIRSSVLQRAQHATHFYKDTVGLCTSTDFQSRKRHWSSSASIFILWLICSSYHLIYDNSYIFFFNVIFQRNWGVRTTKYLNTCLATVLVCLNLGMFLQAFLD